MKKFLIPVDFSEYSNKAIDATISLAHENSEIRLLHAYFDPYSEMLPDADLPLLDITSKEDVLANMESEASKKMDKLIAVYRERLNNLNKQHVLLSHELKRGIPSDIVQLVSDEFKPNIVVMGTRGLDKTTRTIMGSVTASVIESLEIPVLAIPESTDITSFDKVLYASDFDRSDIDALSKLMLIFKDKKVNIHCIHFSIDTYADDVRVLMDDIHEQLNYGEFEGNIQFDIVECPKLEDGMESYIKQHNINLVAMTTHKRNFFTRLFSPSHTKKMLYHTHTPLLAFHA